MVQKDSAHQIDLKPTLHAVLIVVESGDRRVGIFPPQKFGNVFGCSTTTRSSMGKRRPQKDSAHQIVPEIPLHGILMVVVSCCTGGEDVWAEFFPGDVLASLATTNRAMDKWMLRLNSAGRKGPELTLKEVLIVVESWYTTGKKR
jgi:hypothetical protein